jgi:hypothetical protein
MSWLQADSVMPEILNVFGQNISTVSKSQPFQFALDSHTRTRWKVLHGENSAK